MWRFGRDSIETLVARIRADGFAMIENLLSDQDILALAALLGEIANHPHAGSAGITRITPLSSSSPNSGRAGLSMQGLFPHTDRTPLAVPPSLILQVMMANAPRGGETLLADINEVLRPTRSGFAMARALSEAQTAVFSSGDEILKDRLLAPLGTDRWRVKFRYDDGLYIQPAISEMVSEFVAAATAVQRVVSLDPGTGFVADNWRVLHGRNAFVGHREVRRILLSESRAAFGEEPLGVLLKGSETVIL